ncbi:predicted protein [Nematostella vectensis]|uniref:Uncharacterized protein n=1 Tax=Nematostella vectensis TaxID=45351 RepID=A7SPD9_NEMVE|nr:predicted protein [Nematostella vectensis]|eukprot:XP_001626519.1 predicted protein [Nematostella vectensis]
MAASVRNALRTANKINDALLPQFENLKQRKIGRSAFAVYVDYKAVFVDFFKGARSKPLRTSLGLGLLGFGYVVYLNNPDDDSYNDTLLDNANELLQVGERIRNPSSDVYTQEMLQLFYQGKLRRQSFGLFSLMMQTEFGKDCDLYEKHCYYTKTRWVDLWKYVRDFGILGHWYKLETAMIDYDVNQEDLDGLVDDLTEQNTLSKKIMRYGKYCMDSFLQWGYGLIYSQDPQQSASF